MRALITRHPVVPSVALLPVAGRPLLARQLEWLVRIGVHDIALEVGVTAGDDDVLLWLSREASRPASLRLVKADGASADEHVERLGWAGGPVLHVAAGTVASIGPAEVRRLPNGVATLLAIPPAGLSPGELAILGPGKPRPTLVAGWSCRLDDPDDALTLSSHVLAGRVRGVAVPGVHRGDGVWVARSAQVDDAAELHGPVFVGAGAIVRAGATVGPDTILERRAVVERGAVLRRVLVQSDVVVGDGFRAEGVVVEPACVRDPHTGETIELVEDPHQLAHRDFVRRRGLPRVAALAVRVPLAAGGRAR